MMNFAGSDGEDRRGCDLVFLLVEEANERETLQNILIGQGCEVRIVDMSDDFVSTAEEVLPDLVVLASGAIADRGRELCNRLNSRAATESIPVLFICGQQESRQNGC